MDFIYLYTFCYFQEFQISAIERKIIQEIEIRILKITYRELVIEDGEEMVMNVAEHEAVGSSFSTSVKSYRILEGMGVTFHCKMEGTPLPKVRVLILLINGILFTAQYISNFTLFVLNRLPGIKTVSALSMEAAIRWRFYKMVELVCAYLWCCQKMRASILRLLAI